MSFYLEMIGNDLERVNKIDSVIKKYISEHLLVSTNKELGGKKFLMRTCITFYNSEYLTKYISSLYKLSSKNKVK